MRKNFKILLGILTFSCLFSLANFKQNNAHAFVHSKQEIQKNSELFEAADYSASRTTDKANQYAAKHFVDDKAKNYIYNLYRKNADYLTKNYEFYDEIGQSYFYNDTHESDTRKFTNYYQYANYAANLLINNTLSKQLKFQFSVKHRTQNDYFSYHKWEKGYVNPQWLHYSYNPENDNSTDIPLYASLGQARKEMKANPHYYSSKNSLNLDNNYELILKPFWIKKIKADIFMIKMNKKVYYVPKAIFSDSTHKLTVFEKYNSYVDKNYIWSNIGIGKQSNIDQMVFNKNARIKNQQTLNLVGDIYKKYPRNIWKYNSAYIDPNDVTD
ncbi:hypothetical protein [Apilactobacillus timberlakei]|uniref:hypothetical protein n=1 Tax=Apilactobacillus timberlakei TaxID=2008380 RepID=UPI00112C7B87|nr:hypothetical protein [Apilactobacillus timberlakei]TPR19237.1 hypothetical protein DYZ95_01070 [Apilactobacillus timberlakei]